MRLDSSSLCVQVAAQADVVITMLPAKAHVYECYDGPDGVLRYIFCNLLHKALFGGIPP